MFKPNKMQTLPNIFDGISVVYLDNENRNRCVKLPTDLALAKQLAQSLCQEIKTTISQNKQKEQQK